MTAGAARIRIVPLDPSTSTTSPPTGPQARPATVHNQWDDILEQRARRCGGCGEWAFTAFCDWCLEAHT